MQKKSLNQVTLVGRIGQDPKVYNGATAFSVATTESFKGQNQYQDKTEWHNCIAFGKTGDFVGNYLGKGQQVIVVGMIKNEKWNDKNGNQRYGYKIHVNMVQALYGKKDNNQPRETNDFESIKLKKMIDNPQQDDGLPF